MKILLLAPHPFYQERGTPIAVDLLLRFFAARGDAVDVVTFHEGENRSYQGVTIHRTPRLSWIKGVPPGFSLRKIICDFFLFIKALRLAARNKYQIVHAVEEAVFCAMVIRFVFRVPYIFDMDSSMPTQMIERTPALAAAAPALKFFERRAARRAFAVVAVCEALAETARTAGSRRVFVLRDISLLSSGYLLSRSAATDKQRLNVEHPCFMYIGNLEAYQGIDLLLESHVILLKSAPQSFLAIIGGNDCLIRKYQQKSSALGIASRVRFFGPRPLASMADMVAQADILVSPRIKGANTPMKIYSYLQSGKPILATDLPTHTQVLDRTTAMLAAPKPEQFAAAMLCLLENPLMGRKAAACAAVIAEKKYSLQSYLNTANEIFRRIETDLADQSMGITA